tara:strand:- start:1648 stop:1854 length:207 start_codon:yes stop_codon:yes gene_type:complete
MIYKFKSSCGSKELEIENASPKEITITVIDLNDQFKTVGIDLTQNSLYDLIGSLHSLQAKIKREVSND